MSRGYLGKISAVISANTGDYVRKLNESAKETRAFASTVQRTLARASSDASKSLEGIYTPLQRVERALRAAQSRKLSFRGFDGAIGTVERLQKAIAGLQDKQEIDLVVKASGLGSLNELKKTINALRNQDISVGLEGLRAKRASLGSVSGGGVATEVVAEAKRLDAAIAALEKISAEKLRDLSIQIETRQLDAASTKFRQLVSISEQINKPLARAREQFDSLSIEVQGRFFSALRGAQRQATTLSTELERSGKVSTESFKDAKAAVDAFAQSTARVLQVQRQASGGLTGRETQFSAAGVFSALRASEQAQQRASDAGGAGLGEQVRRVQALRDNVSRQFARVEAIKLKPSVDISQLASAEQRLQQLIDRLATASQRLNEFSTRTSRAQNLAFAITGKPQNIQQAEAAYAGLVSQVSELDAVQRKAFAPNLRALGKLVASGDESQLKSVRALISQIQKDLAKQGKVSIDVESARGRLQSLKNDVQKLDAAQRKAFSGNIRRLGQLVRSDDESKLKDISALIRQIERDLAKQKSLNVRTEETKKKVEDIRSSLRGVVDAISGRSSDPFAQLRNSADAAKAAIDKVADARRRASLERQLTRIQSGISADAGASLTPAQLRARARRRTNQLDSLATSAETQSATDIFGPPLRSAQQRTESLKSTIQSLQSQIATLPAPLQASLIPQLNKARDAFASLGKTPTTAAIRAAVKEADRLEKSFQRAKAAAQFRGTFGGFLNTTAAERFGNQLSYVQKSLAAVGVTARGPVASAVNRYQAALEKAASSGTLGTERTKKRMEALIDRIAQAAVATGKLTEQQAKAFATQARGAGLRGDVGRFGVDRLQLGLQQFAFAIDDAFSVTGDFQQRIRAIGNNITQLGFLVGGTTGLFVTLGAVISLQAAVALIKYINNGIDAEDQTKALNDALSRQKSLVESLAQAFSSLADEIGRSALSGPAEQARAFSKQLENITRQQRELRESRVTELDATVQQERARQASLQKQLESSTDAGQRVGLAREIRSSQEAERRAARAAVRRPAPGQGEVLSSLLDTIRPTEFLEGGRLRARSFRQAEQRQAQARADINRGADPENLARVIEQRLQERQQQASRPLTVGTAFSGEAAEIVRAREDVLRLKQLLESLDLPRNAAIDKKVEEFFTTLGASAQRLKVAQEQAAESIKSGIPAAVDVQARLDRLGKELEKAANEIARANKDFAEGRIGIEERNAQVDRARDRVRGSRERRLRAEEDARQINFDRIVNQPSSLDARVARAGANLQSAGLGEGRLARELRVIQARRADAESRLASSGDNPFARRRVQKELEALNQQVVAIESATVALRKFTDYLDRAAQEADSNLQSARQRADEARRADLARSTPRTAGARRRAEEDLRRQEELNNRVQDEIAKARARLEEQAQDPNNSLSPTFNRIRQIDEQLQSGNLSAAEQARLIEERRRLQDRIDRAINQEQSVIDARDASTKEEERRQSALRGRELLLRPGQRARLELDQQLADIRQASDERRRIDAQMGGQNRARIDQDQRDAEKRAREDSLRQNAPAVFALADAVTNALLQGPSRAALQPTDVSTVEGSRELTRLLRGDDAARDQANLVDLQKQANEFLRRIAEDQTQVAN